MPRDEYQTALDDLRANVREMGALVVDRLGDALDALARTDESLAREVIDGDDDVNERYLALEGECIDLLALQQPVAGDLRFVAASFKIITDLERVGDLAVNLGEYTLAAGGARSLDVDVADIGADALGMVRDALDAYADGDVDAARDVAADDDELDALCQRANERVVRGLIEREAGDDAWAVERLMDDVSRTLLTVRDLERVGDHAVNVAARTLYTVENDPELIY
ncbi:phosphate transport system regulatory protein phoU [Halarchaeum acidiphilum MH1-52-1]|uniref:Phosphate-specific transport system accessory protein PhoU n=1 Tax=Halarchaeum acidiphilum MH1-52-1 TaxID=1261545 RepID=U3A449_9EURY|nr:phosphate signaling complex protein PhoU [Halarchaeum acidiphilum]GAD52404.1 phosphate transport system regulatory protein phoU [Halarchaeum acidiphilum MH1-52-1]